MALRALLLFAFALAACGCDRAATPPPEPVRAPANDPVVTSAEVQPSATEEATAPVAPPPSPPEQAPAPSAETPPPPFDASAYSWRNVPGARRFARAGAEPVVVEAQSGGSGCSGGGCTVVLESRVLRGSLPTTDVQYYYGEPPTGPGCHGREADRLFADRTVVEIAPLASEENQPGCGILLVDESAAEYWVVLRVAVPRRAGVTPSGAPAER